MRNSRKLIELGLVTLGFIVAITLYLTLFLGGLTPLETAVGSGVSVLAFWVAIELRPDAASPTESEWMLTIEQFCLGTGVNLLLHAVLTYSLDVRRTPFLVVAGGFFAAVMLAAGRKLIFRARHTERVLLLGFGDVARRLTEDRDYRKSVAGVVGPCEIAPPEGIAVVGPVEALGEIVAQFRPDRIVIDWPDWADRIPANWLMEWRGGGIRIEESQRVYERLFSRVCGERLEPTDLLISAALRGDARTMAIQSVYTNLIGLSFLIALSPVLLLASLAVALFGGSGPIFESMECAGFQYIPFRMLRFRITASPGDERRTAAGRMITSLGIVNLPQLFNIVRGDMALVGPRPARREFTLHLARIMPPFYAHRFSVKPGIIGWAQVHNPGGADSIPEEYRDIEYDLFYIKEGSLWMDIEILMEAISGGARRRAKPSGRAPDFRERRRATA